MAGYGMNSQNFKPMSDCDKILSARMASEEYLINAERIRTLEARQTELLKYIKSVFDEKYKMESIVKDINSQ